MATYLYIRRLGKDLVACNGSADVGPVIGDYPIHTP